MRGYILAINFIGTAHRYPTPISLRCDMERNCHEYVTHIDNQGYVYCAKHGADRRGGGIRCRALTALERQELIDGNTIKY